MSSLNIKEIKLNDFLLKNFPDVDENDNMTKQKTLFDDVIENKLGFLRLVQLTSSGRTLTDIGKQDSPQNPDINCDKVSFKYPIVSSPGNNVLNQRNKGKIMPTNKSNHPFHSTLLLLYAKYNSSTASAKSIGKNNGLVATHIPIKNPAKSVFQIFSLFKKKKEANKKVIPGNSPFAPVRPFPYNGKNDTNKAILI